MPVSEDYLDHVCDLLRAMGPVEARRMFSGAGLFSKGLMFALIADDVLYLKADAETQQHFKAEGLVPFTYEGKSRRVSLGYWRAPERLLDDADEMVTWARAAVGVARRAEKKSEGKKMGPASKSKSRKVAPRPTTKSEPAPKSKSPATSARQRSGKSPGGRSRKG